LFQFLCQSVNPLTWAVADKAVLCYQAPVTTTHSAILRVV